MSVPTPRRYARSAAITALALAVLVAACSSTSPESEVFQTIDGAGPAVEETAATPSTTTAPPEPVVVPDYTNLEVAYLDDLGAVAMGRLNIVIDVPDDTSVASAVATAVGGEVTGIFGLIGLYQVSLPDNTLETLDQAIDIANSVPGVAGAAADVGAYLVGTSCESTSPLNSPTYGQGNNAAHYEAIGLQDAWDIIAASGVELSDVHVGVADTAFMPASTEDEGDIEILTPRGTTDEPSRDREDNPDLGNLNHGTSVTHVVAANGSDGGVAGVASPLGGKLKVTVDNIFDAAPTTVINDPDPDNPSHLPTTDGNAYILPTMQKILRQVEEGATVINMSFGPRRPSEQHGWNAAAYRLFFRRMGERYPNVVFVAAAGNESGALNGGNYYPGGIDLPNVITVAAVDHTGSAAGFTNTTSGNGEVTIAAPGVSVPLGIDPTTDQPYTGSGTSFAAPMVTGAIALIQSINPDLEAPEIRQMLQDTARDGVAARGDADTSKLIPDSVSGRIMRVDDAVLAAINGVRAAADPPQQPLDRDALLAAMSFTVEAAPIEYGVFAVNAGVGEGQDATMSFEFFGEGSVDGSSRQPATSSSSAVWEVTPADPTVPASGKVCRADAARCCVVVLDSVSAAGSYSGNLVIGTVEASGDLVVDTPDGEQVVTEEECEGIYSEIIGKAFAVDLTLGDDGSGMSGPVTASLYDLEGAATETSPSTWTMSGSTVTIPLSFTADGYGGVFVLTGTLSVDGSGQPTGINGEWVLSGVANLTLGGGFTLTRTG